jgi:hypothetical protein
MENGQFKMYTEDTTHTWATEFDGKADRWVAYCFADEYHDFQITDTNTSPRSIFIGRKVGTINRLVNTRLAQIVVTDGNKLRGIVGSFADNWDKKTIINVDRISSKQIIQSNTNIEALYIETDDINIAGIINILQSLSNISSLVVKANSYNSGDSSFLLGGANRLKTAIVDCESITNGVLRDCGNMDIYYVNLEKMTMGTSTNGEFVGGSGTANVYFGYKYNDKTKSVRFRSVWVGINRVEVQNGWCKPLDIADCTALTKQDVQDYIFDRLGINDLSTGAVTIALANAVLNLFTQEEIDAVVARTNITIVGA